MNVTFEENTSSYNVEFVENTNSFIVEFSEQINAFTVEISERGAQGLQGENNYQIAVRNGFVGTEAEWLEAQKFSLIIQDLPSLP